MTDIDRITAIIEPIVKQMGFDLVRVKMVGGKSDPTLQVMAERPDTRQLTIDDCTALSHAIDEPLEAADPIEHAYRLEVSSPGIDRPLTRRGDFADWAGHEARIRLATPVDGAKQVTGELVGIAGDIITVATSKGERQVDFSNIDGAKLVLTDKLINATQPLSTEGADTIKTEG